MTHLIAMRVAVIGGVGGRGRCTNARIARRSSVDVLGALAVTGGLALGVLGIVRTPEGDGDVALLTRASALPEAGLSLTTASTTPSGAAPRLTSTGACAPASPSATCDQRA